MLDLDLDPLLILPLAFVLLLMAMPVLSRRIWGPVDRVPAHIVKQRIDEGSAQAIDIRPPSDYRRGHIPGAINVSVGDLDAFVKDRSDGKDIVLICQSDLTSIRQAARLTKAGHADVAAMHGGMFAWKRAKYPVSTD